MKFDQGKRIVVETLKQKGKATNKSMLRLLEGDLALFEEIREELILDDIAKDKENVGLVYIRETVEAKQRMNNTSETESKKSMNTKNLSSFKILNPSTHRVFLSYGRVDAKDIAFKLEADLSEKGYDVWIDKRKISSGKSWEEQIEKGILECHVFVSLLSPHAVRRPDGVCLDEISMARYNGRKIIPAMVKRCRAPLGIYRLDWVDFQDWEDTKQYRNAFSRLVANIERQEEFFEGLYANIFATLKPLDFGSEVYRLSHDFLGRKWLFDEVDQWLEKDESRVFLITGDPGTGKSAVMAKLVNSHPQVVAYHFCVTSLADSLDPFCFVRSVAAQLATQLDSYRNALDSIDADSIWKTDPNTFFRRLIADPLKKHPQEKPVLILIDALDETLSLGNQSIAKMLIERIFDLPGWVRLVVSSRKEPEILDMLSRFQPYEIDPLCDENNQDVFAYIKDKLQNLKAKGVLPVPDIKSVTQSIFKKCHGNFLYAAQAIETLKTGMADPNKLDSLPDGLVGIYQNYFERIFSDSNEYTSFRPILDTICAAREPLGADQISSILDRDNFEIKKDLEKVAVFFPKLNNCYQPYHKSITEWLCSTSGQSGKYSANVDSGHRKIAEKLLENFKKGDRNQFMAANLPSHLCYIREWEILYDVLSDLDFLNLAWENNSYEVRSCWIKIEEETELSIVNAFQEVIDNPSAFPDVAWTVGLVLSVTYHHEESIIIQDYLVDGFRKSGDLLNLQSALYNLADSLVGRLEYEKALELYKEQEEICRYLDHKDGLYLSLRGQAHIHYEREEYDHAMVIYDVLEQKFKDNNDKEGLARSIGGKALVYYAQGKHEDALKLLKKEEIMIREMNDLYGLTKNLNNQASSQVCMGENHIALELYKEQEIICRKLLQKDVLAVSLHNQALILEKLGEHDQAMEIYKEEDQICMIIRKEDLLWQCYNHQAKILLKKGDQMGALHMARKASTICKKTEKKEITEQCLLDQWAVLIDISSNLMNLKKWEEALGYLKDEEQLLYELDDEERLQDCLYYQSVCNGNKR